METVSLSSYEIQVLIGTTISGCNMSPGATFDLKAAWANLCKLGLIDRTDGLAIATHSGAAFISELLASRLAKQGPAGWLPLPGDLLSHIDDWRSACTIARDAAPLPTEDMDDRSYWQHQLNVLDRVEAQIDDFRAALSPVLGEPK